MRRDKSEANYSLVYRAREQVNPKQSWISATLEGGGSKRAVLALRRGVYILEPMLLD